MAHLSKCDLQKEISAKKLNAIEDAIADFTKALEFEDNAAIYDGIG